MDKTKQIRIASRQQQSGNSGEDENHQGQSGFRKELVRVRNTSYGGDKQKDMRQTHFQ